MWWFALLYFVAGQRIGEAAVPGPVQIHLELLLQDSQSPVLRQCTPDANPIESKFLEACSLWHSALLRRSRACALRGDSADRSAAMFVTGVEERVAYTLARSAAISYAQQRRQLAAGRVGEEDGANQVDDPDSDVDSEQDSMPGIRELREAVRSMGKSVHAAFKHDHTPTITDVAGITSKLQAVAEAVVAGRMANGVQCDCHHELSSFETDTSGYWCNQCRSQQIMGTQMHGCRQCDFDLCQSCYHSRRSRPDSNLWASAASASAPRRLVRASSAESGHRDDPTEHGSGRSRSRRRTRRRGSGATTRKQHVDIFYANVTSMSPKAEHFMMSLHDSVWMAAETHMREDETGRRCRGWTRHYDITAAPAVPSVESMDGSYGGVVTAARKHLATSIIDGNLEQNGWHKSLDCDVAGRTLHLVGVDVLVLGSYARHGNYEQQVRSIARVSRNGQLPFVWVADFNAHPTVLEESNWLARLDAAVVRPDADITCHQGSGSLIDYAVCSKSLVPYITSLATISDVPWKPHDGLRMRLRRNPKAVMVRSLIRPRKLSSAGVIPDRGPSFQMSWEDAVATARRDLQGASAQTSEDVRAQCSAAQAMGIGHISQSLSSELATWARATELQALARAGVRAGAAAWPLLGRGAHPRFVQRPLMPRPRLDAEALRLPGGYGIAARLWATCRVLASKTLTAFERIESRSDVSLMKARLVALTMRKTGDLRRAWEVVTDGADVAAGVFAVMAACCPDATASTLHDAISTFERLEQAEAQRGREIADVAWNRWISLAISGGAKHAHRWTNGANTATLDITAPGCRGPLDVTRYHSGLWAKQWKANDINKIAESFEAVRDLRERALEHPKHGGCCDKFSPSLIKEVVKKFRQGTSIGADNIAMQDLLEASEESLEDLCRIMRSVVHDLAMPASTLMVFISLLAKKLGGTRGIAICTTFYRVLIAMMKDEVRSWDVEVGTEGDSAMPGKSPLDETAWRHLWMEQATLRGKYVVQLLWDVAKFFDSVDIPALIRRAEHLDFPIDGLVLAMQMHRAPRVLRINGCYAEAIQATGRSILAGCSLSTSLSRAFVREPVTAGVDSKHHSGSETYTHVHVDDVHQLVIADSEDAAVRRARREGLRIATGFVRSGLTVSPKSVVTASTKRLANLVATSLGRAGQPVASVAQAEDLGVPTASGARRAVGAFRKRLQRGIRRSIRVRQLARKNPKASKLYVTGVRPQQSYGAPIHGVAPRQLHAMRRAAALCASPAGAQPCITTMLAWRLGPRRDPAAAVPLEQVSMWMRLWARSSEDQRCQLRTAWARALPRVLLGGVRWARVTGPMQATIAVLGQAGWHPVAPDRWISAEGTEYAELDWAPHANVAILEALRESFEAAAWKTAATHFLGRGLESGTPSLAPAESARQWLRRRERWSEVKALDRIVCGGVWVESRRHQPTPCEQCGEPQATMFHRYWSCPCLRNHADEVVQETQWMERLFRERHSNWECLWGRAILPSCLVGAAPPLSPEEAEPTRTPGFVDTFRRRKAGFTDGSGGPRWVPHASKRVGSAVATVRVRTAENRVCVDEVGIVAAPAPGRATVPRAELWAAIMAAREAPHGSAVTLGIDASYVIKGMASQFESRLLHGLNGDLWAMLQGTIQERSLQLLPCKVKAHAEEQVLLGHMDLEDFLGNALADAAAGAAAEEAVSAPQASDASTWRGRCYLIARRLACIEAALWREGPVLVPAPPELQRVEPPAIPDAVTAFQKCIEQMGHRVRVRGRWLQCSRCHRRRRLGAHAFWTSSRCKGLAMRTSASETSSGATELKRARVDEDDLDEDPFGHNHLGLDDAGDNEPQESSPARSQVCGSRIEPDAPATGCNPRCIPSSHGGLSRAAIKLEALRRRVRARERASTECAGGLVVRPDEQETSSTAKRSAPCPSLARGERRRAPPVPCAGGALVTLAKRRRILREQREARLDDEQASREARSLAWLLLARNLPPVEGSPDASVVPFHVDPSHECILCGGFVGCVRCGSVVAMQQDSALSTCCRGHCPPGALGPVRRLAEGRPPRGDRWPSGEASPLPHRFRAGL